MDIKLNYKNADETLAKIREVWDGLEAIKQSIRELAQMGIDLEVIPPYQEACSPVNEDRPCGQLRQHTP